MVMSRDFKILIVLTALSSAAIVFTHPKWFVRAGLGRRTIPCLQYLRQIDGAKQVWALENHKKAKDMVTMEDIRPYMGRGPKGEIPLCPKGGIYKIGRIGEPPSCSVDGSLASFR